MLLSSDDLRAIELHTEALNRNTEALERFAGLVRHERKQANNNGWLGSAEVLNRLRPLITEEQGVKLLREAGHFGQENNGWKKHGRAYLYRDEAVFNLRQLYDKGHLPPVRRK
jgi:hypothetical protein